jgi:DNA-binding transcriptional LysR family regulator
LSLFCRTREGLVLTRNGAALLAKAEQVVAGLAGFRQAARRLTGEIRGKLKLGTIIDPEFTRLGPLLSCLLEMAPELDIELAHGMSGEIPERLSAGDIDAGFFLGELTSRRSSGRSKAKFLRLPLTSFRYRVVAPPGWERQVRGKHWSDIASLPWITTPRASVHHRLLDQIFAGEGIVPNSVALVDLEPSMLAMVKSGVGLSLCRESIALHEKQVSGLVVHDELMVSTELSFLMLSTRKDDPQMKCISNAIRHVWGIR